MSYPRVRRHSWQSSIDIRYLNNPVTCLEIDRVGPWNTQPLSRHIRLIDISNLCSLFTVYIPTLIYTIGLQYQATWRALCLGLRIRHVSRGEGKVLRSSKPLNSQGPCSLVLRPVASCSETRVSPLFEVRVPPVLIEARAASCPRPACLRFSRS